MWRRLAQISTIAAGILWSAAWAVEGEPRINVQPVDSVRPVVFYQQMSERLGKSETRIQGMHFIATPTPAITTAVTEVETMGSKLFQPKWSSPLGVATMTAEGSDILLVKWQPDPSFPYAKSVSVSDDPESVLFFFEVDAKLFQSPDAIRDFWKNLFILPNPLLGIHAIEFKIQGNPEANGVVGLGWVTYAQRPERGEAKGYEFLLGAYRTPARSYLCVWAGKRLVPDVFGAGNAFVPERFPPLRERLKQMDTPALLRELRDGTVRDAVVVDELLSRSATAEDLERLFDAAPVDALADRVSLVMGEMVRLGKVERFKNAIKDAIDRYVHDEQRAPLVMTPMLRSLRSSREIDLSAAALNSISQGVAVKEGLIYLEFRGHTKETAEKLQALEVPTELQPQKERAVREILRRGRERSWAK